MTFARPGRDAGQIAPRSNPPSRPPRGHTTMARLVGAAGLIALTAVLFWLLTDESFRVTEENVTFRGLAHADEEQVRAYLADIDRGPNVFRVRASDIVSELSELVEVDAASATVSLPAEVTVRLDERDPVFIWSDLEESWLVDEEGMLFAPGEAMGAGPGSQVRDEGSAAAVGGAARAALPVVEDGRIVEEPPTVGTRLPAADMSIMRQLLALTPELLGSESEALELRVDQRDGYVLKSRDSGWRALFGRYTPALQPPTIIPRQVQCLRWLLAAHERKLEQVRLVPSDEACGTFTTFDDKRPKGS